MSRFSCGGERGTIADAAASVNGIRLAAVNRARHTRSSFDRGLHLVLQSRELRGRVKPERSGAKEWR
jgi:hypothetical protein